MDAEMDRLAREYEEPSWPQTDTIKDLINGHSIERQRRLRDRLSA